MSFVVKFWNVHKVMVGLCNFSVSNFVFQTYRTQIWQYKRNNSVPVYSVFHRVIHISLVLFCHTWFVEMFTQNKGSQFFVCGRVWQARAEGKPPSTIFEHVNETLNCQDHFLSSGNSFSVVTSFHQNIDLFKGPI